MGWLKRKIRFLLGPFLILAGVWVLLPVAMAFSLTDPALSLLAWRIEVLGRLSDCIPMIVVALGLIVLGFVVAAGGRSPTLKIARPETGRDEL